MADATSVDVVTRFLEVGPNDRGEIVIVHRGVELDAEGVGHIVFSVNQAAGLVRVLLSVIGRVRQSSGRGGPQLPSAAGLALIADRLKGLANGMSRTEPAYHTMVADAGVAARAAEFLASHSLDDLIEAAERAQCACTVAQRDSGHLVECWMPALEAAISKAREGWA